MGNKFRLTGMYVNWGRYLNNTYPTPFISNAFCVLVVCISSKLCKYYDLGGKGITNSVLKKNAGRLLY